MQFYKNNGGWYALKEGVGDYNMLYQFLVMYASNTVSYLLCNTATAIMMLIAFVLTLLHFRPNLSIRRYAAGTFAALAAAVIVSFSLSGNTVHVTVNGRLVEIERFRVVNEASYLSQKDLANLMGLDCKIENSKVAFSD